MEACLTFLLFNRVRDTGNIVLRESSPNEILPPVYLLSRTQFLCSDLEVGWITKRSVDQVQEFHQTLRTVQIQGLVRRKRGHRLEKPWESENMVAVKMRDVDYRRSVESKPCVHHLPLRALTTIE